MTTFYRLSNQQRTDIAIRRSEIRVAIPADAGASDEEAVLFARRMLPDDADYIRAAEWGDILVCPLPGQHGLQPWLGSILTADNREGWQIVVVICLVTLRRDEQPRHTVSLLRWPGSVVIDGRSPPEIIEAEKNLRTISTETQ